MPAKSDDEGTDVADDKSEVFEDAEDGEVDDDAYRESDFASLVIRLAVDPGADEEVDDDRREDDEGGDAFT